MRTLDTILFDLDDTLLDDSTAYKRAARRVADELALERGVDAGRLVNAYVAEANGYLEETHAGITSRTPIHDARTQLWSDALVASGLPFDAALAQRCADDYTRYRADVLELFPGALELVLALRERGCKLGIVTNGFAATHHEKIDRLGLRRHVDALFLADEMGMVKPNPEIFRLACRTLGSEPARTAMVGRPLRPRHHRRRSRSACSRS